MPDAAIVETAILREALQDLRDDVTLHYYTVDVESWYSYAERHLLETITRASAHLSLQVHAERWEAHREMLVGIRRTPAIALYGAQDTGIRYYGAPDGYKLRPFLRTLQAISTGTTVLRPDTRARLALLAQPLHLEVLVSPT